MTVYKVLVSNVNSDITFEPPVEADWSQRIDTDEELIILLNRIAIVSSQTKPIEYPEVEITVDSRRAFITIVDGHIYYTERNSNRQNLQVVAENVPDLLKGLHVELEKPPEQKREHVQHQLPRRYKGTGGTGGGVRLAFWLIFCGIFGFCVLYVFKELTDRPSLIQKADFIFQSSGMELFLERHAGLYVNDYREGSLVLELELSGQIHLYELWRSPSEGSFIRVPVTHYKVEYGLHADKPALLAASKYVIVPLESGSLSMYGLTFQRHDGVISELGPVRDTVR